MFVGNDVNDIPALEIVGIPVGVLISQRYSRLCKLFTKKRYEGAVREICDIFIFIITENQLE